jgi:hypothetical protein
MMSAKPFERQSHQKVYILEVAELAKKAGFKEPFQRLVNAKPSATTPLNFL